MKHDELAIMMADNGDEMSCTSPYSLCTPTASFLRIFPPLPGPGVSVKDLGNFTRGEPSPYALLLPLQDVFAVIRHYWIHEKVSEYKKGELDYTIIKIRSKANRHTVVRVVWENSEDKSNSRATVITEKNWKKSAFGGKSRVLDKYSDVDIMQMHDDRMLAFGR